MFRLCSDDQFEERSSAGTRPLFEIGPFSFQDALDETGALHHLIVESAEEGRTAYEADQATMYELVARYLAGEYEKEAYELEQSPAHHELLDLLELAGARARTGDHDFTLSELEGEAELLGDEEE